MKRKPAKREPKPVEPEVMTGKQKQQIFDLSQTVRKIVRKRKGKA